MSLFPLTEFEQADRVNAFAWASDFQPLGLSSLRSDPAQRFYELSGQDDVSNGLRLRHIATYVTFLETLDPTDLELQKVSKDELLVLVGGLKKLGCYQEPQVTDEIHIPDELRPQPNDRIPSSIPSAV